MAAGDIYADSDSIHVPGNGTKVSGSKKVSGRDPSQNVNWWGVKLIEHIDSVPLDTQGNPMRLCSGGHYAPRDNFRKDRTRKDGMDYYCSSCRKTQVHVQRMTAAKVK